MRLKLFTAIFFVVGLTAPESVPFLPSPAIARDGNPLGGVLKPIKGLRVKGGTVNVVRDEVGIAHIVGEIINASAGPRARPTGRSPLL